MAGDCGVCLYGDYDSGTEFFRVTTPRAKKPYKCSECGREIRAGEVHEYASMKCDGQFMDFRTCRVCAEIRSVFYCEGALYGGQLWQDMQEQAFPEMTTGCLERLETAAAKAYLIQRWQDWKFERTSQ